MVFLAYSKYLSRGAWLFLFPYDVALYLTDKTSNWYNFYWKCPITLLVKKCFTFFVKCQYAMNFQVNFYRWNRQKCKESGWIIVTYIFTSVGKNCIFRCLKFGILGIWSSYWYWILKYCIELVFVIYNLQWCFVNCLYFVINWSYILHISTIREIEF